MVLAEPDRVTMLSSGKQVKWMSLPPRACTWQHRASGEQGRSQTEERAQAQQGKAWTQPGAAGPGGWWWRACLDPSSNLRCYVQALCSCRPAQEQRHFLGPTLRLPTTSLHWLLGIMKSPAHFYLTLFIEMGFLFLILLKSLTLQATGSPYHYHSTVHVSLVLKIT